MERCISFPTRWIIFCTGDRVRRTVAEWWQCRDLGSACCFRWLGRRRVVGGKFCGRAWCVADGEALVFAQPAIGALVGHRLAVLSNDLAGGSDVGKLRDTESPEFAGSRRGDWRRVGLALSGGGVGMSRAAPQAILRKPFADDRMAVVCWVWRRTCDLARVADVSH